MSLTEKAGSDERWATARRLADGVMDERMPRRRLRFLLLIVSILVLGSLAGLGVGFLLPAQGNGVNDSAGIVSGPGIVGLTLMAAGFILGLGGFIWAKRTGRYIPRWRQVASPLSWAERRHAMKEIRGKVEPEADKLAVLRAIANQTRRLTLGVSPIFGGVILLNSGNAMWLGSGLGFGQISLVTASVLFGIALLFMALDYRRAGAFLELHPAPGHDGDH